MPGTSVTPARIRFHSTDLCTDVVRGIGFKARCACGWQGTIRGTHGAARVDAHLHRREQHP